MPKKNKKKVLSKSIVTEEYPPLAGTLLFLDLATKTGWVTTNNNIVSGSGVKKFSKLIDLEAFVLNVKPDHIVFERVDFSKFLLAFAKHIKLRAILERYCELNPHVTLTGIPVATIKKVCTGNGRAKKDEMMKFCKDVMGVDPKDDNEADAYALLYTVRKHYGAP